MYGIVLTNLNSPRPHFGHLVGVSGLLRDFLPEILAYALLVFLLLAVSLMFFESVAGDFWYVVRSFLPEQTGTPRQFTLGATVTWVALLGVLFATVRVIAIQQ
jgi:hypothetical protein